MARIQRLDHLKGLQFLVAVESQAYAQQVMAAADAAPIQLPWLERQDRYLLQITEGALHVYCTAGIPSYCIDQSVVDNVQVRDTMEGIELSGTLGEVERIILHPEMHSIGTPQQPAYRQPDARNAARRPSQQQSAPYVSEPAGESGPSESRQPSESRPARRGYSGSSESRSSES